MSELMRRADIRAHAEQAARDAKGPDACPYSNTSCAGQYWRDVFYTQTALNLFRCAADAETSPDRIFSQSGEARSDFAQGVSA